ncbi:MAG: type II toxin-antitoxin system RelE/ParE family toxin [Bacillota bacterium]
MVRIIWTERAVKNLKNVFDYIAVDSKIYASHFTKRIVKASEKLKYFPFMGRVVPEFADQQLREVLFQNYRIVYRIGSDVKKVEVIAVVHASRDLLSLARDNWELQ